MATASDNPNVSVQEMENDLSCCICFNLLQDPKDLDCPHVYCLSCLQKWVGKQPTIECPECRKTTTVPPGGLENLKSNLRLKAMVEKYADRIEKQKCVPLCPDHEGERQHFFCLTCQKTVCHNCLVFKHPRTTHDIEELKDIARSKKDEIKERMEGIQEQTKLSKETGKQLSEAENILHAATEKTKEDIEKHVQNLVTEIYAKRDDMIQIVETTHQQQMNLLKKKQKHNQEKTARLQNVQSTTQNVLDTAADHVYMTQHPALVVRMDKLCIDEHEAPLWDFELLCFSPVQIPNDTNWFGDSSLHRHKMCGLKLVHKFGHFQRPQGIAANQDGLVAVADYHAKKTEVFQFNGDGYESKFCLMSNNKTDDTNPYNVCVATDGKFYVTFYNGNINIFSPSGRYLNSVHMDKSYSNGPIAASPDGTIITGNGHQQIITLLTCDDDKCEVMKTYDIDRDFMRDIASNGTQVVYISGRKVCAIDFTTGEALWTKNMVWPQGICYESKSNTLLIAEGPRPSSRQTGQWAIEQHCSATGRLISRLATDLDRPFAMTVTHDNKLLVTDWQTVKVYEIW